MNSVSKLTDSLKRALGPISWRTYVWIFQNTSLAQRLIVSSYLQRPLATWPARLGKLLDINVPLAVGPLPSVLPYGAANINNLIALLDATRDVAGDVAECGVFRGASLIAMALYASQNGMNKSFVGFDSFEGFAPAIAYDMALGGDELNCKQPGGMNETSRELVSAKAAALKLRNITLFEGFFNKTLLLAGDRKFSFVHLDCDAYEAYVECLEFFYPRLARGGILLVDEYNDPAWPGCNKAVDEFLEDRPERLQWIAKDNYQKFYFVKG